ncbi:capsule biosynthesis protein [Pasteurellaceae bacterium LFhippo2]|nr:capsule biosynthesis protein [Pasteurellaceae bacterium LFhippo2]
MKEMEKLSALLSEQESNLKKIKKRLDSIENSRFIENEQNTISYKLGYILLHDTKSIRGLCSLPKKLLDLYKYSSERKLKKNNLLLLPEVDKQITQQKEKIVSPKKNSISNTKPLASMSKGLTLLDPISELCWNDAFTGFPLSRPQYAEQIKVSTSQFAFFESAWRANKSTWLYAFTSPGLKHANAQALLSAISLLKEKKMPIIFWNKEDPMHYEMFKPIAKHADYIFTTDSLIVDKYKKELNNPNVWALPFAAPVKKTNPLERFSLDTETVCFAGTYYAKNHENRKKQMDMLLPALLENKGCIYDRASKEQKDDYAYPEIYSNILRDGVDFEEMVTLYKKFKIFLNVNTITQSTTMMSRRVYELLASGTPVVSTPSKAITEQFPGIVITVNNEQEAKLAVQRLLNDSYYWHKQSMLGIREVMSKHTYEQRWSYIKRVITNTEDNQNNAENIRIIALYHGYIPLKIYIESLKNQKNVNIKEIIIVKSKSLEIEQSILAQYNLKCLNLDEFNSKSYINNDENIKYTFITDDKTYNYKYSLWGMLLSFQYSNSDAITRSPYYKVSNINHNFDFAINHENWYTDMREVSSSCVLLKDSASSKLIIDLNSKKIKNTKNEKSILLIDPFNVIQIDKSSELTDEKAFNNFIYRTAPYLGI